MTNGTPTSCLTVFMSLDECRDVRIIIMIPAFENVNKLIAKQYYDTMAKVYIKRITLHHNPMQYDTVLDQIYQPQLERW